MTTLSAVLPLKRGGQGGHCDLDRFSLLLLPSLKRFFAPADLRELVLIVPAEDLAPVRAAVAGHAPWEIRVVCEDDLCPGLPGASGWHRQQLLKLAAAHTVTTDCYLVLDADVVLVRPTGAAELFVDGRPIFQKAWARVHWDWWRGSRKMLRTRARVDRDAMVMGVTPEILHRDLCLELQAAIAGRNRTERWDCFLDGRRSARWTEYTLYWLFVLERGLTRERYSWGERQLYWGIWQPEDVPELSASHLRAACASGAPPFLVIQSNLALSVDRVWSAVGPLLDPA